MKTLKKVTDLKENEVIHCKTEKEAKAICQLMHDAGLTWVDKMLYKDKSNWNVYKQNTVYCPFEGSYGDILDTEDTIYPAKDFLTPKVTKKDILNRIDRLESVIKPQSGIIDEFRERLTKEEAKQMFSNQIPLTIDYESFTGKKMKGFKFEGKDYPLIGYGNCMDAHIGEIGTIDSYQEKERQFRVTFKEDFWLYPADLAIQHIVEDTTTNLQVPVTDNEKEKVLLYLDMLEHARSVNGDWVPDWETTKDKKYYLNFKYNIVSWNWSHNYCLGVFGIAYQTKESVEQAKEKFETRILKYYGN